MFILYCYVLTLVPVWFCGLRNISTPISLSAAKYRLRTTELKKTNLLLSLWFQSWNRNCKYSSASDVLWKSKCFVSIECHLRSMLWIQVFHQQRSICTRNIWYLKPQIVENLESKTSNSGKRLLDPGSKCLLRTVSLGANIWIAMSLLAIVLSLFTTFTALAADLLHFIHHHS